ncbi:MAG: hypothetical protein IAG10_30080 [Planctomycetaceae bacterium]|nr:hypothetical protein [Planctomycetaceae bacterium]
MPNNKDAWLKRAEFSGQHGDDSTRIACLVSAVDTEPTNPGLVSEVAWQVCRYINDHLAEIPKARRGVYLASIRSHMEKLSESLDATGLSRLAWLFLLEDDQPNAWKYANEGCKKDSANGHCIKILERLDRAQMK